MLNINPINNYNKSNINFKSQKDYSKIYKEMQKITVEQEEKIKPKIRIGNRFAVLENNIKQSLKSKINSKKEDLEGVIDFIKFIKWPVILGVLSSAILAFLEKQCETSSNANKAESEEEIVNKTDSLYDLYKNKAITFDKFQEELGKLNRNK